MRKFRSLLSLFLIAAMLFTYIPGHVHGQVNDKHTKEPAVSVMSPGRVINPLYEGMIDPAAPVHGHTTSVSSISTSEIRATLEEAAEELRQGMIQRKAEISVTYPANAGFDADAIWQQALSHTGDPTAGDYLMWQWSALSWYPYYDSLNGVYYYTMVFYPEYFTTAAQEAEMDTAVSSLLNKLNLWSASDYDKVKGIYDWMCANIKYDYDNLDNSSYMLKHSAYAALVNKTAVCQGYSLLFYRLCLELGVDARYVSGTANGGGHGWNIVKLNGLYYNVDATWDATWYQSGAAYNWFLRGSSNFTDHVAGDDYSTPDFKQEYPIDPADYGTQTAWPITGTCGDSLTWKLSEAGVLTISGSGDMYDYYFDYPGWYEYAWHIKSVVIEKNVSCVGAYAFYYCTALESVSIAGSTDLHELAFIYCESLSEVAMPQVVSIGSYCFLGCTALNAVSIPASVTNIGVQVFNGCPSLKSITVADGNTYYCASGNVLFSKDMTRLVAAAADIGSSYTVPASVRLIDEYAFTNCAALKQITVCDGVETLPEGVFYGCLQLETVHLPASLTIIGDAVFSGCVNLSGVALPEKLNSIGYRAFENCAALTQIGIPASLEFIGELAFSNSGLETVRFHGSAPEIADDAFNGVFCEAYYPDPACYPSWTYEKLSDYGGYLVWNSYAAHDLQPVVTQPTCTERGYTTYTCAHCGYSYTDDYVSALGHNWDDGVITVEPTEDTPGERKYTCFSCGETKTEAIDAVEHEHSYVPDVTQPTCTESGYTTHTCSQCGHSYVDSYVDPAGHSYGDWSQTQAPSCTASGTERRDCSKCSHSEQREVSALGHSFTNYTSDANATCTNDGTKTAKCDRGCGSTDTVTDAGSATGHSFTDTITAPTCTEQGYTTHACHCGHSYVDTFVAAVGHQYGQWYESKAPTCTQAGEKRRDCDVCDHYEFTAVSAKGHSYSDWAEIKAPTCTEKGEKRRECSDCDHYESEGIDPKGHSFTAYVSEANATCTEDGTKTAQCDHGCGATDTIADTGSRTGHQFSAWYTVKPATTEEEGQERRDCEKCGHYEERAIPVRTGPEKITSDIYEVGEDTIRKIPAGTTIADFLEGIPEAEFLWFYKDGKEVSADSLVSTGMEIHLIVGDALIRKYTLVVTGDTNGDGSISITDMLAVKSHILKKKTLDGAFFLAGDVNSDGNISITDFIQIKSHILGKSSVTPHSVNTLHPHIAAVQSIRVLHL